MKRPSASSRAALRGAILIAVACLAACSDGDRTIAVGTLERDRLDLVAAASEPVVARPVAEGAYVEANTLLIKLDPSRLEARVDQASAARARAEARLAELERGPRHEVIAEARAQLKGAEGRLQTARNDLKRTEKLVSGGVASKEVLDQRRANFDEALAGRDAGQASLDAMVDGTTQEELDQAEAALSEAAAALTDAQIQLARLEVRAPTAGWLDALPFELGEQPPVGGVVAVLLADETPYARIYVPAPIRIHVKTGTLAKVKIDGLDKPVAGRVRMVASDAAFTPYFALTEHDRGRLVYPAKVDLLDASARGLPSGIPVEVEFQIDAPDREASNDVAHE